MGAVMRYLWLGYSSKSLAGMPIAATIMRPHKRLAGCSKRPVFGSAIVTVTSACTASAQAEPSSAFTPVGTSTATTVLASSLMSSHARLAAGRSSPAKPVPRMASTTTLARSSASSVVSQSSSAATALRRPPAALNMASSLAASPVILSSLVPIKNTFTSTP